MSLLEITDRGIYCPAGDFFIDPWKPVTRAVITHGHADHSRWGHRHYLCTKEAHPVIRYRLGDIKVETMAYGEQRRINGVAISFHPAGHIVGSAQVRVEHGGEIWVVSGDYKLQDDGLSTPFEPVPCHTFITESTFGLPVYSWKPQEETFKAINDWWRQNKEEGKVSVLGAYALGKAQRLLAGLDTSIGPVFTHGAVENVNEIIRSQGIGLPSTTRITRETDTRQFPGSMVIATPSATGSAWMKKFKPVSVGLASGWMMLRGTRRRRSVDRGFVLSDHADWEGLNTAIAETGAECVYVTHGYTEIFTRWLRTQGYEAYIVKTEYEGEEASEQDGEAEPDA